MSLDDPKAGPFEALGLLASASRDAIERRAEALRALLKLGLAPPEGDAVRLAPGEERTAESVAESARQLRDPQQWLRESVRWPDCRAAGRALSMAADLLEGAAGRPTEPASLVRHLALEYLSSELAKAPDTEQPADRVAPLLATPSEPPLFVGQPPEARGTGGDDDPKHR